jgi:ABC-type multidrug transport system fused ATPase/permease subunit
MGVVSQHSSVFLDGSVGEQLQWSAPGHAVTAEACWQALADADCLGFVPSLDFVPTRLSGGQMQRLSLARALVRSPSVLLLDEATSALDAATEAGIVQTLEGLRGRMTIISVTHRLATTRGADQIIVLQDGMVVEVGTYATLMANRVGVFHDMVKQETGRKDIIDDSERTYDHDQSTPLDVRPWAATVLEKAGSTEADERSRYKS